MRSTFEEFINHLWTDGLYFVFLGTNGEIEYSVSAGDENQDFAIAQNGTIYTVRTLDRETKPLYNLVVTASDLAGPEQQRLSSTVQVRRNSAFFFVFTD